MSFLTPLAFALGVVGALAVVAVHLLTTERPPREILPTARFVPLVEARAVARSRRPTDLFLLALRVLVVLLVGAAFARPVLDAPGPRVRSVVLLDVSGAVADPRDAASRARAALGPGSTLVLFDTGARIVSSDSVSTSTEASGALRPARGALSPALVAARSAAGQVARGADSLRLVIVSPMSEGMTDAATAGLRAIWPGRAEVVRVAGIADTALSDGPELVTSLVDDPLRPALARLPRGRGAHRVRIVRRVPTASDTAWTRAAGHLLVIWPYSTGAPVADAVTVSGAGGVTVVAPLVREALVGGGEVLARWRDGAPAVLESPLAAGCVRTVAIGLPLAGDLTLRGPFNQLLQALLVPCGGRRGVALSDSLVAAFAGVGPLAPARLLANEAALDARLPAWLLALALVALGAEWLLRRRTAR